MEDMRKKKDAEIQSLTKSLEEQRTAYELKIDGLEATIKDLDLTVRT